MEIICTTGPIPGRIMATLAHDGAVRQVPMDIIRHPAGGWQARCPGGAFGLRCHTVNTAILLEASEAYATPVMALAAD